MISGFHLKVKYVIDVAGPIDQDGLHHEKENLKIAIDIINDWDVYLVLFDKNTFQLARQLLTK